MMMQSEAGDRRTESLSEILDQWVDAALSGDRIRALAVIDSALDEGVPLRHVLEGVLAAGQAEVGERWARNQATVAQEHMATALAQVALSRVYARSRPVRRRGRVVVACVTGEHHGFPARLLADCLDLEGLDVRYAGADVPVAALGALVAEVHPAVVALSVTMRSNLPALRGAVAAVRAGAPEARVFAGGAGCGREDAEAAGAEAGGDTAADTVRRLVAAAEGARG